MLPDVPTFREAIHPDLVLRYWHGIVAPAGVPQSVLVRLAETIAAALHLREIRDRLPRDMDVSPVLLDAFATLIREEQHFFGRIIRERKIAI